MAKQEKAVPVIFRAFKKSCDVIALFPTVVGECHGTGSVGSYMHVGQHGAADLAIIGSGQTRATRPSEHAALAKELRQIGYRLKVTKRVTPTMRREFRANLQACRR